MNPRDVLTDPVKVPEVVAPAQPSGLPSRLRARIAGGMSRTWFWPTVATAVIVLFGVGHPELWRDELRSWSAATRSFSELFHLLGNTDAATALYYLVLKVWILVFGESVIAMRLLSVVAMAGAAACVSLIGQRLFDRRAGIVAGLIFALVPAVSRFGQEVRPYATTMLLAVLSTLLLLRAIERPTWLRFLGYGLAVAGLALTQIVAMPILAAHAVGVAMWWRGERALAVKWVVATALGLALEAPVVLLSHAQYGHQVGALPEATLGELTRLPPRLFLSWLFAGAVISLGAIAFAAKLRPAIFVAAWAVLPIGAIWVVSNLGDSYWMARYMLFTIPAFVILAGAAVARLNTRAVASVLIVLAVLGAQDHRAIRSIGSHDQWTYPAPEFDHDALFYSDAAQILAGQMRPDDAVVYAARGDFWLLDIGLAYHLRGQQLPRDVLVQTPAVENGDFWPVECPSAATCLAKASPPRVWVLSAATGDPFSVMEPDKKEALMDQYTVTDTFHTSGIALVLMERGSSTS